MPVGYTQIITKKDGNITFQEFASEYLKKSDQDMLIDNSTSKRLKFNQDLKTSLVEACKDYHHAKKMSVSEAGILAQQEFVNKVEEYVAKVSGKEKLTKTYLNFLNQARKWTPQTDELKEIREYMIGELERSLELDCSYKLDPVKPKTGLDYRRDLINEKRTKLDYAKSQFRKEIVSAKKSRKIMTDFYNTTPQK